MIVDHLLRLVTLLEQGDEVNYVGVLKDEMRLLLGTSDERSPLSRIDRRYRRNIRPSQVWRSENCGPVVTWEFTKVLGADGGMILGTVDLAFGAMVDRLGPTTVLVVDVEGTCVWSAIRSDEVGLVEGYDGLHIKFWVFEERLWTPDR